MTQIADPATTATESSAPPLIDRPLAELMDWDSPFRHTFVPGSSWAPWLAAAPFPPKEPPRVVAPAPSSKSASPVRPPDPPAPSASDAEYDRYQRDYEARLDQAYADWKRNVFVSLFEPWIIDRRAIFHR
ncbi:MAG: hypothetical protein JWQ76_204 [Ramlibacter sp.]|nr:hypothetical protein [Ramlibacter sp.]